MANWESFSYLLACGDISSPLFLILFINIYLVSSQRNGKKKKNLWQDIHPSSLELTVNLHSSKDLLSCLLWWYVKWRINTWQYPIRKCIAKKFKVGDLYRLLPSVLHYVLISNLQKGLLQLLATAVSPNLPLYVMCLWFLSITIWLLYDKQQAAIFRKKVSVLHCFVICLIGIKCCILLGFM